MVTRALSHDTMGRLKTCTNGRGITTTYTYDAFARITAVAFSGATGHVEPEPVLCHD